MTVKKSEPSLHRARLSRALPVLAMHSYNSLPYGTLWKNEPAGKKTLFLQGSHFQMELAARRIDPMAKNRAD